MVEYTFQDFKSKYDETDKKILLIIFFLHFRLVIACFEEEVDRHLEVHSQSKRFRDKSSRGN